MSAKTFEPTAETRARGAAIRRARQKLGLSQAEVAAKIEISRVLVSYWEAGRVKSIPLEDGLKLSPLLQLPLAAICEYDDRNGKLVKVGEKTEHPRATLSTKISDDVLTVALQLNDIPDSNPAKSAIAVLVEQIHRAHNPSYWEWHDGETVRSRRRVPQKQRA